MLKFNLIYMLFLSLLCSTLVAEPDNIESLIDFAIEQSIQQNYTIAESIIVNICEVEKDDPRPYFFLAAVLQSKMMDYETDLWEDEFLNLLRQTEIHAKKNIMNNSNDPWAHFYLGSAYSYRAFHDGRGGNVVSALKYGLSGISELHKSIEIDSSFYDAYFGIGSYKYWRGKYTRYINWLPLIADERQYGIEMVKKAATKGEFTRYAAINELTWILIDAGKVSEALTWAKIGLDKYPNSRFFLWGTAKSYYLLHKYADASQIYQKILNSILNENINNHYNEIILYLKLAQCNYHLEQYEKAQMYCDKIFDTKLDGKIRKRLKKIFKKAEKLQKAINKRLYTN